MPRKRGLGGLFIFFVDQEGYFSIDAVFDDRIVFNLGTEINDVNRFDIFDRFSGSFDRSGSGIFPAFL